MRHRLSAMLSASSVAAGPGGIYDSLVAGDASPQHDEVMLRESVAAAQEQDYFGAVARSHSIPVMDREVDRFLERLPPDGLVLDVGGCWGWHWRRLASTRPDIGVIIIDFVRANLVHAHAVLGPLVGTQVALVCADATALPFPDATDLGFDGIWSVQVLQHIPDFEGAVREAHRVLKRGGWFSNYSLHATPINRLAFFVARRRYHMEGHHPSGFMLTRASDAQRRLVADVFGAPVLDRYTEVLFNPELRLLGSTRAGSLLGRLDARLASLPLIPRLLARQRAFTVRKA